MGIMKKFINSAINGLGYAFGYYMMKNMMDKANNSVKRAEWKRNIKQIKGKFRIRKKEMA